MKGILIAIVFTFFFTGFNNAQHLSIGDTVVLSGNYKKAYWKEELKGHKFKSEHGIKYLVITKIKKSSEYYLAPPPEESSNPIMTVKKDPYESMTFTMYQSGELLEQAGNLKNVAIFIQVLGIAAGTSIAVIGKSQGALVTGYTLVGVSSLTGFVMNIVGNSKIKKAGGLFKKEKLKL